MCVGMSAEGVGRSSCCNRPLDVASQARWPQGQVRRLYFPKQTLAPGRGGTVSLGRLTFKVGGLLLLLLLSF